MIICGQSNPKIGIKDFDLISWDLVGMNWPSAL